MKKKWIIIGSIILVFLLIGLYFNSKDNFRFKFEYEIINRVELSNGKKIIVNIPLDNRVKYVKSADELMQLFKEKTGVLYFGYSTCPWCRNALPVLIDSILDNDIDVLYYVDIKAFDFSKKSKEIYEILDEYLKVKDDGEKVLAVPDVYVLKNGNIVAHHRSCVESYKNPYKGMNEEQIAELKSIYDSMIKEIK